MPSRRRAAGARTMEEWLERGVKAHGAVTAAVAEAVRRAAPVQREEAEQVTLAAWLDWNGVFYTATANGGARHKATAGRLKAMGVKAGVPDILIFEVPSACHLQGHRLKWSPDDHECPLHRIGVAIELKAPGGPAGGKKGQVSPAQGQWLLGLRRNGWLAFVAYGAGDAIKQLTELGFARRGT